MSSDKIKIELPVLYIRYFFEENHIFYLYDIKYDEYDMLVCLNVLHLEIFRYTNVLVSYADVKESLSDRAKLQMKLLTST